MPLTLKNNVIQGNFENREVKFAKGSASSDEFVAIVDQRFTVKQLNGSTQKANWVKEHQTLQHLSNQQSLRVPRSYGYFAEGNVVRYVREFVEGQPTTFEDEQQLYSLAETVSSIHQSGVVVKDLRHDNIVADSDKQLVVIDFGRASRFAKHNIHFSLAKLRDLFSVYTQLCRQNKQLYKVFSTHYHAFERSSFSFKVLSSVSLRLLGMRKRVRDKHRGFVKR